MSWVKRLFFWDVSEEDFDFELLHDFVYEEDEDELLS